jgi:preprotein translocase subunit YajC
MNPVLLMGAPPQQGGGAAGGSGNLLFTLLPFVLIFAIFYFLVIRPQAKRQRETVKMLDSLKQGDRVVTSGGLFGTVAGVKDNVVVLKVADQVRVEVAKSAITAVVEKSREA